MTTDTWQPAELNPATAVMELAQARREIAGLLAELSNCRELQADARELLADVMDANRTATHAAASELARAYREFAIEEPELARVLEQGE